MRLRGGIPRLDRASPLARGLLGWWPVTAGGAPIVNRATPGVTGLAFTGTPTIGRGLHGPAVTLNGSTDYAEGALAPAIAALPVSAACWFQATEVTSEHALLAIHDGSTSRLSLSAMGSVAGDPLRAGANGLNGPASTTTGYTAGTWHHACGVWAATNDRRAYLDGGGKGTSSTNVVFSSSPTHLRLGNRLSTQWLAGAVREVAVWSRILSDEEVARLAADPFALWAPSGLTVINFGALSGSAAPATGSLSATLDAATCSGSATSVAPGNAAGSLAAALDAATLAGSALAGAAGAAAGALDATLDAATLAGSATFVTAASSAGSLDAALEAATCSGSATASASGSTTGSLATTLADTILAGSAGSAAPAASAGALAVTLAGATLSGTVTAAGPGNPAGILDAALDAATCSGAATASAPGGSAAAAAVTLEAATCSGAATSAAPGNAAGSLSATLELYVLSGSAASVPAGATATGSLAATLADWTSVALATAGTLVGPGDILQFLDTRFQANADLVAGFPGNIHFSRAERDPIRPYLVVDIISEIPRWSTEDDLHAEQTRVQFTIVTDAVPEARQLRQTLIRDLDTVAGADLGGGDLVVQATRAGGKGKIDEQPNPDGGDAVLIMVDYLFLLSRNR